MANIKKTDNGTWRVRVSYTDHFGKRKWKTKSGFATKRSAQDYATTLEYDYVQGGDLENKDISFISYLIKWYQTFREPNLSDATKDKYIYTIKVAQGYFGNQSISDIKVTDYQEFLNFYGKGDGTPANPPHAKATAAKINGHIKAAVKNAVNDGVISKDFTQNTKIVFDRTHTRPKQYLSYTEGQQLIEFLKAKMNNTATANNVYGMILTALLTGMRASEICGLTWDNVDLNKLTIKVAKTWDIRYHTFKPTKNESSKRLIEINQDFANILAKLKLQQNTEFTLAKKTNDQNLVFNNVKDNLPDYSGLNNTLRRTLKASHIDHEISFHGLRHTHASILLYKGVSIAYISHRLGHKNIDTTTRVYLHIIQELQSQEAKKTVDIMDSFMA